MSQHDKQGDCEGLEAYPEPRKIPLVTIRSCKDLYEESPSEAIDFDTLDAENDGMEDSPAEKDLSEEYEDISSLFLDCFSGE